MYEVHQNLFVGDDTSCQRGSSDLAVVHACKHPCHVRAVGYTGSLPSNHPNYLVLKDDFNLYLNMIDPDKPLFMPPLFTEFLDFSKNHWQEGRPILVHCNRGESRSPTLAMMFMAKELDIITNNSYQEAAKEFQNIYPSYNPGLGIQTYLRKNWQNF
jgi:predicted protein tyrosine phosphatase